MSKSNLIKHPAHKYAEDIRDGKIVSCKYTILAVERYFDDLEHGHERGLYFDVDAALHRIEFYRFCRHFEGEWAGQVIEPEPWQQFIDWNVYGWKNADGSRRFRTVYTEVARKNGKSTKTATDGNYLTEFDDEPGAQVYTAATKLKQAAIIHGASRRMVQKSPALRKRLKTFKNSIFSDISGSKYLPLGQDSDTEDGLNVHAALIDEYHAHKSSAMYDVLRSGMGSRRQPLMIIITTSGFDTYCACHEERDYLVNILEGRYQDDTYFGIIYTLDVDVKNAKGEIIIHGDDWTDESIWIKANPNLNVSVSFKDLQDQCRRAKRSPQKQNEFKTKRLNIWTESLALWITAESWRACNSPVDPDALLGCQCYGAFDLSATTDMTAWVLCFPPEYEGDKYKFIYRFFMPQEDIDEKYLNKDVLALVKLWIKQGYVKATPGNVVDYSMVEDQIKADAEKYDIVEIAFDKWNATQLVNNLMESGFEMVKFEQGIKFISASAKQFEILIANQELAHGGNPVIEWMISCTEIYTDANDNIKPIKPDRMKASKRIDGVVASIMAVSRAIAGNESSVYETEEIMTF